MTKKKDAPKKATPNKPVQEQDFAVELAKIETLTGIVEGLQKQVAALQARIDEFFGAL